MTAARKHLSLRAKLALIFVSISLLLLTVVAVALVEIEGIHLDAKRVSEESREAQLVQAIVLDLRGIKRIQDLRQTMQSDTARSMGTDLGMRDQAGHLGEAIRSLQDFRAGPHGTDPSEVTHQASEERILAQLESLFLELQSNIESDDALASLEVNLAEAMRGAEVLASETHLESIEALLSLDERAADLLEATLIMVPIALAVLALVYLMFSRSVINPVLELQRGASRIGAGNLDYRIQVHSRDEVGSLCSEINRMADQIQLDHDELEKRVHERTRQLIRAGRLVNLGTIAAGIAHEINNPLASIASCAEGMQARLQDGQLETDVQEEYLAIISKEADRARQIGGRLLDLARQEPLESRPLDLAKGIHEAYILLKHEFEAHHLNFDARIEAELPAVQGDDREWKQVLLNLLSNAVQASPEGASITLTCKQVDTCIQVIIEDEGGGIPSDSIDQVFDPFFTTKSPDKGTGMGLAIVDSIVDRHAGQIRVENGAKGARFIITFPIPVCPDLDHGAVL